MKSYLATSSQWDHPGATEEELKVQRGELGLPPFVEKEDHAEGILPHFPIETTKY